MDDLTDVRFVANYSLLRIRAHMRVYFHESPRQFAPTGKRGLETIPIEISFTQFEKLFHLETIFDLTEFFILNFKDDLISMKHFRKEMITSHFDFQ